MGLSIIITHRLLEGTASSLHHFSSHQVLSLSWCSPPIIFFFSVPPHEVFLILCTTPNLFLTSSSSSWSSSSSFCCSSSSSSRAWATSVRPWVSRICPPSYLIPLSLLCLLLIRMLLQARRRRRRIDVMRCLLLLECLYVCALINFLRLTSHSLFLKVSKGIPPPWKDITSSC